MHTKSWLKKSKQIFGSLTKFPERIYLAIALVGVVGFALITPPFHGPDEEAHYIRAQYIAHGYFLPVDVKGSGVTLPESIQDVTWKTFYTGDIRGNTAAKYDINHIKSALKDKFNSDETYKPGMISYSPIPYLPAIPVIVISNLLNLSPLISMYLARLALGVFCVLITFFFLKKVPSKRYFFVGIALVPMLLFQQAVISTDGVSYALLFSFICFILYLYSKKNISKKEWITTGILCIAITLAKPLVFLFLPLIIILVKKERAVQWIAGITTVCVLLLGGLTIYNSHLSAGAIDPNVPTTVNSEAQLNNIKEHPVRFLRVMWNSYMTSYGDDEVRGVFGIFGAADTAYPLWMVMGFVILLSILAVVRIDVKKEYAVQKWVKWSLVAMAFLYFILANAAIYLSFTPYNFDIVYGVQGRYFIPILMTIPLLITPFLVVDKKNRSRFITYTFIGIAVFVLLALFITFQRYYLYTP